MKKVLLKKFRTAGVILLGIVLITTIFIVCSTRFIKKENYRKSAWEYVKHDKSIIDWNSASVDVIKLPPGKGLWQTPNAKFNRILLNLNSNQAVRVTFHTNMDSLLGPIVIYYNPFTKQIVGIQGRD